MSENQNQNIDTSEDQNQVSQPQMKKAEVFFYIRDPYSKEEFLFPSGKATRLLRKYVQHLTRYKYDKHYDLQLKLKRKDPIKQKLQKKAKNKIRKEWNKMVDFLSYF